MAEIKEKLRRQAAAPLADSAYYAIKNRILQGLVLSGEALLEEKLSAELGMSRTPIRTAFTRLESEGLLVSGPDRTMRVPDFDRKTLADTFLARLTVETEVAALAALRAGEEEMSRLSHLIWNEEMSFRNRDDALTSGLDRMFHIYLATVAGNCFFTDFVTRINARVSLFLALSDTLGDAIIQALAEHALIVEAIRARNPEAARCAMRRHLENVERRISEELYPDDTPPADSTSSPPAAAGIQYGHDGDFQPVSWRC